MSIIDQLKSGKSPTNFKRLLNGLLDYLAKDCHCPDPITFESVDCKDLSFVQEKDTLKFILNTQLPNYLITAIDRCLEVSDSACIAWIAKDGNTYAFVIKATHIAGCEYYEFLGEAHDGACLTSAVTKVTVYCGCYQEPEPPVVEPGVKQWINTGCVFLPNPSLSGNNALIYDRVCGETVWLCSDDMGQPYWFNPATCTYEQVSKSMANLGKPTQTSNKSCEEIKLDYECVNSTGAPLTQTYAQIVAKAIAGATANGQTWPNGDPITADSVDFQFVHRVYACVVGNGTPVQQDDGSIFTVSCDALAATFYPNSGSNGTGYSKGAIFDFGGGPDSVGDQIGNTDSVTIAPGAAINGQVWVGRCRDKAGNLIDCSTPPVIVNQPPVIVPGEELPDQTNQQGTPITPVGTSQKFTDSDGTIVSYSAAGLPAGLTINTSTGQISGTATAAPGDYNVVVTAVDDDGASVDCPFVWTITEIPNVPPEVIPGQELPDQTDVENSPITPVQTSQKFTDSDGTVVSYSAAGLPAGLTIDAATGTISGTPTAAPGDYDVVVTATDDDGATVDCPFVWTITPEIQIVAIDDTITDPVQPGQPGPSVFDNDTVDGSGSTDGNTTTPTVVDDGGMTGVTFNPDGTINIPAGTPDGDYTITYEICAETDPTVCDQAQITLTVVQPTEICYAGDCTAPANANGGEARLQHWPSSASDPVLNANTWLDAINTGPDPMDPSNAPFWGSVDPDFASLFTFSGSPDSDTIVSVGANGFVSGTTAAGEAYLVDTYLSLPSAACMSAIAGEPVTDILLRGRGEQGNASHSIWYGADPDSAVEFARMTKPHNTGTLSYSVTPEVDGSGIFNNGQYYTGPGNGTIAVQLGDASTPHFTRHYVVDPAQNGSVSLEYSSDGGATWQQLPPEWRSGTAADQAAAQLNESVEIWTCDLNGDCTSTAGGTDTEANVVASGAVQVTCPDNVAPEIIPGEELPDQTSEMGSPITPVTTAQKFRDTDGTIVSYSATGLPAGLTIDAATGAISGTPTAVPGDYNVVVTATDDDGATVDCPFVWTVTEPPNNPPTIVPGEDIPDQTDTEGQPITPLEVSQKFTDSDGTIVSYAATGLPASLVINAATGQISGTLDAGTAALSPYSVVVTATDDDGDTVDCPFDWIVEPDVPTKAGVPLGFGLDGASAVLGPNAQLPLDPGYVTGLPNDQVWVNFDDGETVEFMFEQAFSSSDPANQSLVFEAGFNPTQYTVELLMCDGTYKAPQTVVNDNNEPSKVWTYDWYSESIGGGSVQTSTYCTPVTLADLGVGANEIVQGVRITVDSAVALNGNPPPTNQGDLAGVYVDSGVTVEDGTGCVPPSAGPEKAFQPDRFFAKWEDPSVSVDVSQLFTGATGYSASGLPAGLSLNGSNITGSPTAQGTGTMTITATNADGATDCEIPYEIGSCPPESIYEEDFNQYHTGGGDSNTIPTAPGSGRGHWTEAPGTVRYLNYGGSPGLLNTIWYSFSGFNGSNNGFLRIEPITVTPGEEYKLCYRAAQDNGPGGQRVEYRENGGAWQTLIPNYTPVPHNPGGSSVNHRGWGVYEGVFTATGTNVEFRFVALQNTTNGNDEGVNDICLFPTAGILS